MFDRYWDQIIGPIRFYGGVDSRASIAEMCFK